ncbi:odorant receptor 33a-like [Anopheles nili]|uniref:odorant receptor 33a-like n=1 Tax=Anopheles nili TaxID=185578 RepID=UPI00237A526D|nr:odorant receptor 33a-like [Anopheles nili]
MVDSAVKIERLLTLVGRPMDLLGLNILKPNWRPSVISCVVAALICFQPVLTINSLVTYRHTLDILIECLSLASIGVQVVTRSYFYLFQRDLCRRVLEELRGQRDLFGADGNERLERLFRSSVDRMMTFYRLLYGTYLISLSLFIMPLVMPDPRKYNLPLAFQLPGMPPDETALFWYVTYIYHVLLVLLAINHLAPIDAIIMVSLISISTRIGALRVLLDQLDGQIGEVEWHHTEHLEPVLDRIIELHIDTKRFTRQIYHSYRMHFFISFGMICSVLCMCLNVIATTPRTSVYPVMAAAAVELFVVCYFGNTLLIENDKLPASVYGVRWYRLTVPQQKKILFLLANTQPSLQMSAVYLPVNMTSFVTVCRAAYSYYTLLN